MSRQYDYWIHEQLEPEMGMSSEGTIYVREQQGHERTMAEWQQMWEERDRKYAEAMERAKIKPWYVQ